MQDPDKEFSVKKVAPKLSQFQEQIDHYEAIHEQVKYIIFIILI